MTMEINKKIYLLKKNEEEEKLIFEKNYKKVKY
jgi:hypothetical protein